jgi:hypothetical protein
VRPPAADHDFPDRGFTGQARLAFAAVSSMLDLEETGFAICVNII